MNLNFQTCKNIATSFWLKNKLACLASLFLLLFFIFLGFFIKNEQRVSITQFQASMLHFDIEDEADRTKKDEWNAVLHNSNKYKISFINSNGSVSSVFGVQNQSVESDISVVSPYKMKLHSGSSDRVCVVYGDRMEHNNDFSMVRYDSNMFISCAKELEKMEGKNASETKSSLKARAQNVFIDKKEEVVEVSKLAIVGDEFKLKLENLESDKDSSSFDNFAIAYN